MTNMSPETRADMFKRGYVYLRGSHGANGMRKVVRIPYSHEEHELIFDTPAYETHKAKGFKP